MRICLADGHVDEIIIIIDLDASIIQTFFRAWSFSNLLCVDVYCSAFIFFCGFLYFYYGILGGEDFSNLKRINFFAWIMQRSLFSRARQ